MPMKKGACLENMANKKEGQEVWLADDFVEIKGAVYAKVRPREDIAHFCNDATREVPCGRQLQSWARRRSSQEDQGVPCDGRLLNFSLRKISGKPNRAGHRQGGFMQRREAGLIQQRPCWLDARQPCLDGWILQHAGSYHRATLM